MKNVHLTSVELSCTVKIKQPIFPEEIRPRSERETHINVQSQLQTYLAGKVAARGTLFKGKSEQVSLQLKIQVHTKS